MSPAPSDLPMGDAPTLGLVHPTDEELRAQWKKNGAAWKGALSLEAYMRREVHLASQDLTRNGGITYWALVDTAAKDRIILSGCETLRKKALVAQSGKVKDVICHGIGSVFCPPELRRRGYAARMMKELAKALETWQAAGTECLFSVLWSDIGKEFYASHGWEPFNSAHISVSAMTRPLPEGVVLPEARPLHAADLAALCETDERLIRKNMESRPKDANIAVALIPDIATIEWHHSREEFVGNELHGKVPLVKGAIVGTEPGKRVWCYWTRMWYNSNPAEAKDNTLHLLRLVVEDGYGSADERNGTNGFIHGNEPSSANGAPGKLALAIAALMQAAQKEAKLWKMAEVEAWTPTKAMVSAAQLLDPEAQVVNRDKESISSLRWHLPHDGRVVDSIDWIGNEKYGWC